MLRSISMDMLKVVLIHTNSEDHPDLTTDELMSPLGEKFMMGLPYWSPITDHYAKK